MNNMCSYRYVQNTNTNDTTNREEQYNVSNTNQMNNNFNASNGNPRDNLIQNDFFSIDGDRLEVFGISINIDDLIILIMLFFMFKENQIDYGIIIILALILFDQN